MDLLGAERPQAHQDLVTSAAWDAGIDAGAHDPRDVPALRAHLEYLQSLIGPEDTYASQVTLYLL